MGIEYKQYKAKYTDYTVIVYAIVGNMVFYYDIFGRVYIDTIYHFAENYSV